MDITIDFGNDVLCAVWLVGIFYLGGKVMNMLEARYNGS